MPPCSPEIRAGISRASESWISKRCCTSCSRWKTRPSLVSCCVISASGRTSSPRLLSYSSAQSSCPRRSNISSGNSPPCSVAASSTAVIAFSPWTAPMYRFLRTRLILRPSSRAPEIRSLSISPRSPQSTTCSITLMSTRSSRERPWPTRTSC